jgi:hypothetical protein
MCGKNELKLEFRGFISPLCQCTCSLSKFLCENKVTVIPHPPYAPYLVPRDCFIFPELKMVLKESRFNDITITQAKLWMHF